MLHRSAIWLALCVAIAGSPSLLRAQGDRGTVTGIVADSSGALVPHVQVTLTNEATGIATSTVTTESGNYTATQLPIGTYIIRAKLDGFKTYVRSGIPVQVGQTIRINIGLEIGQVEEKTTVTAEAPLVNMDTSDVGMVINKQTFLQLPLALGGDIRNPSAFIFLSPGVSGGTWEKHIAGSASFTDAVFYDGAVLSGPNSQNDQQYNPSVDAVAEFKMISNNYSAEYGHALGGVTSFTLKSGTNQVHGSAFEFLRNEKLDARGFFSRNKVPTRQNEFGGTVGGPIRKNKTFFFGSVDSFRRRQGAAQGVVTVPLPEFLRGDFSRWTSQIYDPATTRSDGKGGYVRDPFANNQIPTSRFSTVSKKVVAYIPTPHMNQLTNNYISPLAEPLQDDHNYTGKVDHMFNSNHKLFGSLIYTNRPAIKGGGNGVEGPAENHTHQDLNSRLWRVAEDWTMSPTTLNHFTAFVNRIISWQATLSYNQGWVDKLGIKGVPGDMFPTVNFNQGFVGLGNSTASGGGKNAFGVTDTLTKIKGQHSLKFGIEVIRRQENSKNVSQGGGTFTFSNLETARPTDANTGNAVASFLLGAADRGSTYIQAGGAAARWTYYGAFAQDDYKITRNLTLNLGLRWELQTPYVDPQDRMSYMDPSLPNPGAGNIPGAMSFAGTGTGRNGWHRLADIQWKNFQPRLGFAYSFAPNWVARGGYGISYFNLSLGLVGIPSNGFSINPIFSSGDVGVTPAFNWDDGLPQNFARPPTISPTILNGQSAPLMNRAHGGVWPYMQQWNMTLERQIGRSTSIRATYMGNKGTHLYNGDAVGWDQVDPTYLGLGTLLNSRIDSPQAVAAGYKSPFSNFVQLMGSRATVAQSLRPYPQYNGVGDVVPTYGNSLYNSLQLYAEKRMAHGLHLTFAYTFSKSIDDTPSFSSGAGAQNYLDRHAERSISAIDQPHVVSFSYIYELPFGRGKSYFTSGAGEKVLGGWTVSAIHRYTSGTPLGITVTNTLPISNPSLRANVVPGVDQRAPIGDGGFDPNRDLWLNPKAFVAPPAYTFGNTSRYLPSIRTPGSLSESLAILKDTHLTERFNLQFRTELSNPLNRVVFGGPATSLSSAGFGRISSAASPRNIQFGLKLMF